MIQPSQEPEVRQRHLACWAQPDPPPSLRYPTNAEYVAAREAADRPPKLTAIDPIRLTLPFLSLCLPERLYETLRTCKQMTSTVIGISSGVEFSPAATYVTSGPSDLFPCPDPHRPACPWRGQDDIAPKCRNRPF